MTTGGNCGFIDGRKFGKLWLADDPNEVLPVLGPDPLAGELTVEWLALAFEGRSAPVKALMLEQSIIPGMGNIYGDESLFLAGIHPLRPAGDLSADDLVRLKDGIVAAFTEAMRRYETSRLESWPDPPLTLEAWSLLRKDGRSCPPVQRACLRHPHPGSHLLLLPALPEVAWACSAVTVWPLPASLVLDRAQIAVP